MNFSNLTHVNNAQSTLSFANSASNGVLIPGLSLAIFIIIIFKLKDEVGFVKSVMVSGFCCSILTILGWAAHLLSRNEIYYPLIYIIITAFAAFYVKFNKTE